MPHDASNLWKWTEVEEREFQASKQLLLMSDVLVHYMTPSWNLSCRVMHPPTVLAQYSLTTCQMAQKDWLGLPHGH